MTQPRESTSDIDLAATLLTVSIKAVLLQHDRLKERRLGDPYAQLQPWIDAHFYLVAAFNIRRGLVVAQQAAAKFASEALDELEALPDFALMRHILEHSDAYLRGKGREQISGRVTELEHLIEVRYGEEGSPPTVDVGGHVARLDSLTPNLVSLANAVLEELMDASLDSPVIFLPPPELLE